MVIFKCDKCGLTEEHSYFSPKLIGNIENEEDYHKFWYVMVAGSGSYIDSFPIGELYVEKLKAHLCKFCYEKWIKFRSESTRRIEETEKEIAKDFMNETPTT